MSAGSREGGREGGGFMCVCVCSIPANTSIYQSACAIVFIISVPVLRERVTVVKVTVLLHTTYLLPIYIIMVCVVFHVLFVWMANVL